MRGHFDPVARTYDQDFTDTAIGQLQRGRVWHYLKSRLDGQSNLTILELNCGTGEDALMLAQMGHRVMATDISEQMLIQAQAKDTDGLINFRKLDINDIGSLKTELPIDLVFSNFGGINCIGPEAVERLGGFLTASLRPGGFFLAVVMPPFCLWEFLYYHLKSDASKARRRQTSPTTAIIAEQPMPVWYYTPRMLASLLGKGAFNVKRIRPVGFFIPPTYLEGAFSNAFLGVLHFLERMIGGHASASAISDHFYIEMQKTAGG